MDTKTVIITVHDQDIPVPMATQPIDAPELPRALPVLAELADVLVVVVEDLDPVVAVVRDEEPAPPVVGAAYRLLELAL